MEKSQVTNARQIHQRFHEMPQIYKLKTNNEKLPNNKINTV